MMVSAGTGARLACGVVRGYEGFVTSSYDKYK
jgi:hypothetical protein